MDDLLEKGLTGHYLGGGEVTCCVLVRDDLYLVVKSNLLVYSTRNAALLHVQCLGLSEVTGLSVNHMNSQQLFVATRDGSLSVWDMTDWTKMKCKTVASSICSLLVSKSTEHFFVVTKETEKSDEITTIKKHDLATLSHVSDSLVIRKACHNFLISSCGGFILFIRDKRVRVINTSTCATFTRYTHDVELYAATLHTNMNIAAVADKEGKICLLNDWNVKGNDGATVQHWHANKLGGMAFAPRSEVLFSGGLESVLVKWLGSEPQFLPRIGQGIKHVLCPDSGDLVVIVTEDTAVHIVSLNTWTVKFKLSNVLRRVAESSRTCASSEMVSTPSSVILTSTPGNLQVFDVEKRKHIANIDITSQNKCTGRDRNKTPVYIDVTHFKVSEEWLVTVERRDDGFLTPESRLKFWSRDCDEKFSMKTCFDPPHNKVVTSLALGQTTQPTAVTTSTDLSAKVWMCAGNGNSWSLAKTLKHRNGPSFTSAISGDGSVLAVAYKGVIVVYSTHDWEIEAEIPQNISRIGQVFLAGYYLLTTAKDLISVWDLTSLSLCLEISAKVNYIVSLPDKTFLAFVSRKSVTDAFLFGLKSAVPLAVHKFVCPGLVTGASLVGETVIVLNSEQELYTLSLAPPPPLATSPREHVDTATVFTQLLKLKISPSTEQTEVKYNSSASKALAILDVSSHVLPPVSSICANVLSDLLPSK